MIADISRARATSETLDLPGRKRAGPKGLVTRYEGNPGNDQIRNGNRKTGAGRGGETGSVTVEELDQQHITSQPQPADPALTAEDRTWDNVTSKSIC